MRKVYMIGEKNGKKYVAHTDSRPLDNAREITKAEYRRRRAAGIPSWGERVVSIAKQGSYDPKRALHWAMRNSKARREVHIMEYEWKKRNWQARQAKVEAERAQATRRSDKAVGMVK